MSKFAEMTDEQYFAAQDEFEKKYGAPRCEPIKVLDLIMRREFAEAILNGEKKVEVRNGSEHYMNRLTDKKVNRWSHGSGEFHMRLISEVRILPNPSSL